MPRIASAVRGFFVWVDWGAPQRLSRQRAMPRRIHDAMAIRVFISYSHRDEELRHELDVHLSSLRREGRVETWDDLKIEPGERWEAAIAENLEAADVVLLLVSAYFLDSDYAYEKEMTRALERHDAGEAEVVPIILRSCRWKKTPFGALQALPAKGKPVTKWADVHDALYDVVEGIEKAIARCETRLQGAAAASVAADSSGGAAAAVRPRRVPRAGEERTHEKDGSVLLYVPGGSYTLGSTDGDDDEKPIHTVKLSPYWIGKYPVTNAQYGKFLEATGHEEPEEWHNKQFNGPDQPVVGVTWHDAQAYCAWAGLVLPSEAQWEAAARGTDQRTYPWGNAEPTEQLTNFDGNVGRTTPVGRYPDGAGPFGTLDQAGNVWEWCVDLWDLSAYAQRDGEIDPVCRGEKVSESAYRVLRGGSWAGRAESLRAAYRSRGHGDFRVRNFGFRVCRSVPRARLND
ncbi:MAG: SUMF1/EgtB/PvdO family nonheme iron enzyme [Acidobacteriota bacterium]